MESSMKMLLASGLDIHQPLRTKTKKLASIAQTAFSMLAEQSAKLFHFQLSQWEYADSLCCQMG
ncbi:MAG: hypothetical protein EBT95_00595 [Verrucomicrobia bacterium]|nr:hypothetical protein [Verrucomicrobiota bacterium]